MPDPSGDREPPHPRDDLISAVVTDHARDAIHAPKWRGAREVHPEAHVRDWATFALRSPTEGETSRLRQALADNDDDTRAGAIVGLARLGDRRIIPIRAEVFASGSAGSINVEAAALAGDPRPYTGTIALEDWRDVDKAMLAEAIRACPPRPDLTT